VTYRLESVRRDGTELVATFGSDYGGVHKEKRYEQVVVNHGIVPMDELYFELRPLSTNGGEVNYEHVLEGKPQTVERNPGGRFQLFRIGDAVSSRNTHAAIYDALRIMKDI
jgi:hypothetical protein